jgi:hypothetical protein
MRGPGLRLALVLALVIPAFASDGPAPVFEVEYTNPGLTPAHWVLTLNPDGSGHFHSERGDAPHDPAQGFEAANVDRDIQVSAEYAVRVFATARQHKLFNTACESHMKVAFQGWKKLSYRGPDGAGSCTFNYAKEKDVQELGESLVAVAEAIEEGARLEVLLQHDPLGLDKEMEYLTEAAGDGRVQQVETIRGILERLAGDEEVMDRVRKRARELLAKAQG